MRTFGPIDERSMLQLRNCERVAVESGAYEAIEHPDLGVVDYAGVQSALMADHHPGYSMPIGGVLGLEHHVGPGMVGYDIGCGNLYAETNIDANLVNVRAVMDEIYRVISFGIGRANTEKILDHPVFERIDKSPIKWQRTFLASARNQLGTVGSGNHYVDLFRNRATGRLGVGVHFGSRGLGHRTASAFLAIAAGHQWDDRVSEGEMDAPPLLLDTRLPVGEDYVEAMNIALEYAYAGREWVVDRVVRGILLGDVEWSVHNNHNEARRELHAGRALWVHRKGATPAHPGVRGFVGATMGEDAVIIEGRESSASASALYSSVHGAGRVMSRTAAAGKSKTTTLWRCRCGKVNVPVKDPKSKEWEQGYVCDECDGRVYKFRDTRIVKPGLIDFEAVKGSLAGKGIELRGGGADEAPGAYKRLPEVLTYHAGTIEVLHTLEVRGVCMAGRDVFDPFKD